MLFDLSEQPDEHRSIAADVLIVGAGVAGLILADRLRRSGARVVIVESGGREQAEDTHPLNRTVQLGAQYGGASHGRFRCLGGTSTRWGGALIPFERHDLSERRYAQIPEFPIDCEELFGYLNEAEEIFGLQSGPYNVGRDADKSIGLMVGSDSEILVRFAKWPAFEKRNLANVFRERIVNDSELIVYLNASACSFDLDVEDGRMTAITARSVNQRSITISARQFAICAGAIETTRLLLLMDRQHKDRVFAGCEVLGAYFNDHISMKMATIEATQVDKLNRLAGFRFAGSTMRSLRFELAAAVQEREGIGSGFGHISFRTNGKTGFDALRDILRFRQRSNALPWRSIVSAGMAVPYFIRVAIWRMLYGQLLWPRAAEYELHFVAEQLPRRSNYIALSTEEDCFGLPLAAIKWEIGDQDLEPFFAFRRYFQDFWERNGLSQLGELKWSFAREVRLDRSSTNDVYHPAGTTRMGRDPRVAVVDSDMRCFAVPNLWIGSTSVFPSGGGENPTLMLILLVLRMAEHLGGALKADVNRECVAV